MPEFSRNMAFVIGINNYDNGIPSLRNAVNDAKKLVEILQEKHGYNIWVCFDDIATLQTLNKLLWEILPQQVTSDDRLLFYFAGHGIALNGDDGPEGYLIPQDAKLGDTKTYLPMTQVNESLSKLPCRHFLGILDCCFAGAFRWSTTRDLLSVPEVIHQERYDRFISDPAWQVITSAAYDQKASDAFVFSTERDQGEHSPFAAALLEALAGEADIYPPAKEGNPTGDGVITATELYLYLRDRIEPVTIDRRRQTPGIWPLKKHDKGEYIFLTPEHPLNLPPAPPLDESQNPYRGLQSFDEQHSHLFFGRQALTEQLYQHILGQSLTVVLGASGTGKSSLVKAGLIPYLKQFDTSNQKQWRILIPMRPGELPLQALNNALVEENLLSHPITHLTAQQKVETFATSIADWIHLNPTSKLLLVVDQTEELLTLCRDDQERENFLNFIAQIVAKYSDNLRIILTLRSDFEPQFRNTVLEPYWQKARFVVPAMTREELRSCIEEPASARVMYFEPHSLVDNLIDEVMQMPGALPLLSFTLSELYLKYLRSVKEGQRNNRAITQEDYEQLGGVTRSLTQRADSEYEELVKQDQAYEKTIRNVMLRMVSVGSVELARRRVPLSELEYPESEQERVKEVIRRFAKARLLVQGQDTEGKPYVEPAHDALVRGWQKLLSWKQDYGDLLNLQRRLTPAAQEWNSKEQSQGFQKKVEPLLDWLDKSFYFGENLSHKVSAKLLQWWRQTPNLQKRSREKQEQFLWNANPYLDILNNKLQSSDNWFNQLEADFIQRSVRQKQRNSHLRWITAFGVILGLSGLYINSQINQRKHLISQTSTDRESAEVHFSSNQANLDAMGNSLQAVVSLKQPLLQLFPPEKKLQEQVEGTLQKAIYTVSERNRIEGFQGTVRSSLNPKDQLLAIAEQENSNISLWNLQGQRKGGWNTNQGKIRNLSFSPDGQLLATVGENGTVSVWNLQGQKKAAWKGHQKVIRSVSFSPNGQLLATASDDHTVRLWDLQGNPIGQPLKHDKDAWGVTFSPNGQLLATSADDSKVRLWNLQGQKLREWKADTKPDLSTIKFSPNGQFLATGGQDTTVRVWNLQGQKLLELEGRGRVWSVEFSPDNQFLASAPGDGTVRVWKLQNQHLTELKVHRGPVRSVSFSSDGQQLISAGDDGTVHVWSLQDHHLAQLRGYQGSVESVLFSPDGQRIATAGEDGTVLLWNLQGQQLAELRGHQGSVNGVSFNPNGQQIATAGEDGTVRLWNLQGQQLAELRGHQGSVNGVSFNPNGQQIATAGKDGTVRLWNLQGQQLAELRGHQGSVNSVSFSPNGQQIATAGKDGTVRLWNLQGNQQQKFEGHLGPVNSVVFSRDGKQVASGGDDSTIRVWNLQGNPNRAIFQLYRSAPVTSVAFSPDGKRIFSSDNQGNVQLWNLLFRQQLTEWQENQGAINSISLSPDYKLLATAGDDGTIKLWRINESLDDLTNRACDWMRNYLEHNPKVNESDERHFCDGISTGKLRNK